MARRSSRLSTMMSLCGISRSSGSPLMARMTSPGSPIVYLSTKPASENLRYFSSER